MKRCCGVLHTRSFHKEDKGDNSYLELMRLAVAILMDINEEWLTGRRYLNMEECGL